MKSIPTVNLIRYHDGTSSNSDRSTRSTILVRQDKSESPAATGTPERRVRFREENNLQYDSPISLEERQKLFWYKSEEYTFFRMLLLHRVRKIQKARLSQDVAWFSCLEEAFANFLQTESVDDIMHAMQVRSPLKDADHIGLEKWLTDEVLDVKQAVRSALVPVVVSNTYSPERLRRKSRELSRTTRLWSHFVAVKAAESLQ